MNGGQFINWPVTQSQLEVLRDKGQFGIIAVRLFALVEKVHATCFHVSRLMIL